MRETFETTSLVKNPSSTNNQGCYPGLFTKCLFLHLYKMETRALTLWSLPELSQYLQTDYKVLGKKHYLLEICTYLGALISDMVKSLICKLFLCPIRLVFPSVADC